MPLPSRLPLSPLCLLKAYLFFQSLVFPSLEDVPDRYNNQT